MEEREKLRFHKLLKAAANWNVCTVIHAEVILCQRGYSVQIDPEALMALTKAVIHCIGKERPRVPISLVTALVAVNICLAQTPFQIQYAVPANQM